MGILISESECSLYNNCLSQCNYFNDY